MAKCAWAVLCRRSIIDKTDNTVSLIEVLENIGFVGGGPSEEAYRDKPVLITGPNPEAAHFVTLWYRDKVDEPEGPFKARLKTVGPNGKGIAQTEFAISLAAHERVRHILRVNGLLYVGPGRYRYVLETSKGERGRWTKVTEVPLQMGGRDSKQVRERNLQ